MQSQQRIGPVVRASIQNLCTRYAIVLSETDIQLCLCIMAFLLASLVFAVALTQRANAQGAPPNAAAFSSKDMA